MSPDAVATDQVYYQLKADIMGGRYPPTAPLNVHSIAVEIGMSISPIRDAMERLVGERLLVVRPGGGFLMPPMSTEIARDLYTWHAYLVRGAVRSGKATDRLADLAERAKEIDLADGTSLVVATEDFFGLIGGMAENSEHLIAIRGAGNRLHALRLQETHIRDRRAELIRLALLATSGKVSTLRDAITAYHRRRLPHLSTLVSALYQPVPEY